MHTCYSQSITYNCAFVLGHYEQFLFYRPICRSTKPLSLAICCHMPAYWKHTRSFPSIISRSMDFWESCWRSEKRTTILVLPLLCHKITWITVHVPVAFLLLNDFLPTEAGSSIEEEEKKNSRKNLSSLLESTEGAIVGWTNFFPSFLKIFYTKYYHCIFEC